ncbi:hypothetical protein SISSUDRAFT_1050665 [Sistotremastrum suecicum HHB10207 ss-3]|uniref:EamA domain-containing protein n=1 Tax=Sistotremastrum suecicum HHB10207 ss-3 TaxID=1314776 RepID=A0A166B0M6_9AGAM|nr:hypothetical protein SISSUDRAFT_1050665 [Sistotremastrum suecicum HHB10207 ss-3]
MSFSVQLTPTSYTPDTPSFDHETHERESFLPQSSTSLSEPQPQTSLQKETQPSSSAFLARLKTLYYDNTGLLLIGSSQAFFALMNLFVKFLTDLDEPVPALELVWARMIITYLCCISYMLSTNVEYPFTGPPEVRKLLVFRGVSGFFGLFGVYYSLQYLSLSDATVLTFLAPSATGVAGYLFLKESFSRREAIAGLCSLVGVILIARPESIFGAHSPPRLPGEVADGSNGERGTPAQRVVAVCVALVGVLGATGAYTSIRAIGKRAHTLHSLAFFSLYCVVVSTLMMTVLRIPFVIPTQWKFVFLLFAVGLMGFFAQTLLILGLQRETASRGTMAVYVQILFAGTLEQIFLHVKPSVLSVLGTIIILVSAMYVALTKQKEKEKTSRPARHVHWEDGDGDEEGDLEEGLEGAQKPESLELQAPTVKA